MGLRHGVKPEKIMVGGRTFVQRSCGNKLKDPGKYKEHSRFKQHGNQMCFHVASSHGKVVQAIELHKWRKHGHQHDQQEHDFWRLALHKFQPRHSWKSAGRA